MAAMDRRRELMENIGNSLDNTLLQTEALIRVCRIEGHSELGTWAQKLSDTITPYVIEIHPEKVARPTAPQDTTIPPIVREAP